MAFITLVGNEKGGVGKSTIALNLAISRRLQGKDVLVVDTDRQKTISKCIAVRNKMDLPKLQCVQLSGDIVEPILDLSKRYEEIIIDAGGQDSEELRSAMVVADHFLIPTLPSQIDCWTLDEMQKLYRQAKTVNRKLRASLCVSKAATNPFMKEDLEAMEFFEEFPDFENSGVVVHDRKVYRDAVYEGRGVMEMDNAKARNEIAALEMHLYVALPEVKELVHA